MVGAPNDYLTEGVGVGRGLQNYKVDPRAASRYTVLKITGGVFEFNSVEKIQVLSDSGMCLKAHQRFPSGSTLILNLSSVCRWGVERLEFWGPV